MDRFRICRMTALAFLILSGCAEAPAPRLQLMDASAAAGLAYTGEMLQSAVIERAEGDVQLDRELRLHFRVTEAAAVATDRVTLVLALDSVRAAMGTPHGRQVYDTRTLPRTVTLGYARRGGRPDYSASPEVEDFNRLSGGPPPISLVLDRLFPMLPDSAVQVGGLWEGVWTETGVEAMTVATRRVRARFRLERIEDREGVKLAHIEIVAAREADGTAPAEAPAGTLEGRGRVVVGLVDGVVREAEYEEVVTGSGMFPGGGAPFRQTTRYRVSRAGAPHGAAS